MLPALGLQVMRALGDYLNVKCHACVGGTSVREDTRILQASWVYCKLHLHAPAVLAVRPSRGGHPARGHPHLAAAVPLELKLKGTRHARLGTPPRHGWRPSACAHNPPVSLL